MRYHRVATAAALTAAALALVTTPATAEDGGTITGRVWFDRDGDGAADAGEPGRANASVTVSRDGAAVTTVRAAMDGRYAVTGLAPGDYQVTTRGADGYLATTPAAVDVRLETVGQADFGMRGARLEGSVWADRNGDGVRQAAEAALPIPEQIRLEGIGFGATTRRVTESGRFSFEDLPGLDGYVLFAPDRSGSGAEFARFTMPGRDSAIDPATGRSAPFSLVAGEARALGVGYRPARADLALADLPVLNAAAGRPVDLVAKVTNHGTTASTFQVRVTTPDGVRVTGTKRITRAAGTRSPHTVTGVSAAPLAPGATVEVRFTLVGGRSLTGEITVTVGAGETRSTTLNVTAARHVAATVNPKPQGRVAPRPYDSDAWIAPAQVVPARTETSSVISTVLASVLVAASAALVVVLRRRVTAR